MKLFKRIFFRLYRICRNLKAKIQLEYYKSLWEDQLFVDNRFSTDSTFSLMVLSGNVSISFAEGVSFRKFCSVICSGHGRLVLNKNVTFNNYCSINCLHEITIGDNTIFGEGVRLYDHNHGYDIKDTPIVEQAMKYGSIVVGRNCWIGSNTIILPNVTIGDNVIIGANNLIYKSIEDNTVVIAKAEKNLKKY